MARGGGGCHAVGGVRTGCCVGLRNDARSLVFICEGLKSGVRKVLAGVGRTRGVDLADCGRRGMPPRCSAMPLVPRGGTVVVG